MKLKRIIEQVDASAQYYDLGKDFSAFQRSMDMSSEQVKGKFEQAIGAKLNGKKIRARASRGYKQFEKDYDIDVATVSLDDYYDNYVVVARSTNGKEYFLKPGFKIQIIGGAEQSAPEQPQEPEQEPQQKQQPQQPQQPQQSQQQQPQSATPEQPEQPVKEAGRGGDTEIVKKYTVDEILADAEGWLPKLLADQRANLKKYVPQEGIKRTIRGRSVAVYGVVIPITDAPGLTTDAVKHALSSASGRKGAVDNIYTLQKFDATPDKYVVIVKKVFNY